MPCTVIRWWASTHRPRWCDWPGSGSEVELRSTKCALGTWAWQEEFDGVWACASLLHVPLAEFAGGAARLVGALRPGGASYMSFKLGCGERVAGGRSFTDHTEETLRRVVEVGAISIAEVWVSEDVRQCRACERWMNAIALRPEEQSIAEVRVASI